MATPKTSSEASKSSIADLHDEGRRFFILSVSKDSCPNKFFVVYYLRLFWGTKTRWGLPMTEHLMRGKLANMRKQADVLTGFPDPRIFASTCRTLALHLQDLRRSVSKESESNGGNNVLSNYTRYLFSEINRGEAEYFWRLPPDKLSKELQELSEFIKLAAGSGSIARAVKAQAIELATNIRDAYDRMFAPAVQAYTPRLKLVVNNR